MRFLDDDTAEYLAEGMRQADRRLAALHAAKGRVQPLATFRCQGGCWLLKAYQTPDGVILHRPAVRLTEAFAHLEGVPAVIYQGSGTSGRRSTGEAFTVGERVTWLTDTTTEPQVLACRHGATAVGADRVRHAVLKRANELVDVAE